MKNILNIIKSDKIIMNSDKRSKISLFVFFCVFICILSFIASPLLGTLCPMYASFLTVSVLFGMKSKYNSLKFYSILPVRKSDTVNSRFLSGLTIYCSVCLLIYLVLLVMLVNKINYMILIGETEKDMTESLASAAGMSGTGFFNIAYAGMFSFGLCTLTSQIKTGLIKPSAFSGKIIKAEAADKRTAVLAGILVILVILAVAGVIPVSPLYILMEIFAELASIMHGIILSGLLILSAIVVSGYNYISAMLEYESNEQ